MAWFAKSSCKKGTGYKLIALRTLTATTWKQLYG